MATVSPPSTCTRPTRPLSRLIEACDHACQCGDLPTVARDARLLAGCVAAPVSTELLVVAHLSDVCDPDTSRQWGAARDQLRAALRTVDPALHPSS